MRTTARSRAAGTWLRGAGLALVVAAPFVALAADDFASLGIEPDQAKNSLFGGLRGGFYAPEGTKALASLDPEHRRAAVQTLGAFARDYFGSKEFQKEYSDALKAQKPKTGFGLPHIDVNKMAKDAAESATGQKKPQEAWKLDKDSSVQLKKQLQYFLDESATVDFAATTHGTTVKIFDKPEYESKSPLWKMCYRAGKDVTEEMRSFAQTWLKDLE